VHFVLCCILPDRCELHIVHNCICILNCWVNKVKWSEDSHRPQTPPPVLPPFRVAQTDTLIGGGIANYYNDQARVFHRIWHLDLARNACLYQSINQSVLICRHKCIKSEIIASSRSERHWSALSSSLTLVSSLLHKRSLKILPKWGSLDQNTTELATQSNP